MEEEDNDPSKYHTLDDGQDAPHQQQTDKTTRVWTQDGAKMVDINTKDKIIENTMNKDSEKVKASILVDTEETEKPSTEELDEINLDTNQEE